MKELKDNNLKDLIKDLEKLNSHFSNVELQELRDSSNRKFASAEKAVITDEDFNKIKIEITRIRNKIVNSEI